MPHVRQLDHKELRIAEQIHAVFELAHAQEAELLGLGPQSVNARSAQEIHTSGELFLGAYDGEALAGVLSVTRDDEPDQLRIARLVVHPGFQRRGIGTALVKAALHRGKGAFFSVVAAASNAPALALYQALGFTQYRSGTMGPRNLAVVKLRSAV